MDVTKELTGEWRAENCYLRYEDIFKGNSRWRLFWDFIVKRKGIDITWTFTPPETTSQVYVEYVSVDVVK